MSRISTLLNPSLTTLLYGSTQNVQSNLFSFIFFVLNFVKSTYRVGVNDVFDFSFLSVDLT